MTRNLWACALVRPQIVTNCSLGPFLDQTASLVGVTQHATGGPSGTLNVCVTASEGVSKANPSCCGGVRPEPG